MEKYVIIGDIAIQHNPDIIALVWAGVRFCLQVALNDMQTFEAVSSALEDIAGIMGSCRIYENIHLSSILKSSEAVIRQLPRLYTHCLIFMADAISYFSTKTSKRVTGGITNPFETSFKPLIENIKSSKVELEDLASDKIGADERKGFLELTAQLGKVSTGVEGLLARADETKRREVLKWLSEVNFGAHHEKASDLRFDGTGGWLFEKRALESWVEDESSSVMWLYGKAGSGKTVLSSLVIDTLTETYKSVPTIYFYCHYGERERQETLSITRTLLKQLSMRCELDPPIVSVFDSGTQLNLKSSEGSFAAALSQFEKVFVVVDALDECSEEERKSIVMLLTRQLKLEGCRIKVFLTSRPENDLRQLLKDNPSHQIDANDTSKDITPFVVAALDSHIANGMLLGGNVSARLRRDLVETISGQADGMFLWAKFQLDYICKQANEIEVRNQLTKLPTGLNKTYNRIWKRIMGEFSDDDTERKWALKTLTWVLRAKRPLSSEEILQATAIELANTKFEPERMASSLNYLIQVCGNFVALDVQTDSVRFVHYSVQEFLDRKPEFDSSEDIVTQACFTVLGNGNGTTSGQFYSYASEYWEKHSRCWQEIDNQRGSLIQRFLFNGPSFADWNTHRQWQHPLDTPYKAVSYFNLPVILNYLQQHGSHHDRFILDQSEPLALSVRWGFVAVVELLLTAGADSNFWHADDQSALGEAAENGSKELMELLFSFGADITVRNLSGRSTLEIAVTKRSGRGVKSPLAAGADPNIPGEAGGFLIQKAARNGSEEIVELLLAAGADVNAQGGGYGSALEEAVKGSEKMMDLVFIDFSIQLWMGGSVLQIATRLSFEKIVDLLLIAGADPNIQDSAGGFLIQKAVINGSEKLVELLLAAGADVNAQGGVYGSALEEAVKQGSETMVELILAAHADVNIRDWMGGSALQIARRNGFKSLVELLLAAEAGAEFQDSPDRAVLRTVVATCSEKIAQLLLTTDTDVNVCDSNDGLASQISATNDHLRSSELLLHAEADSDPDDGGEACELIEANIVRNSEVRASASKDLWRFGTTPAQFSVISV
ncbi:hypothetical protein Q9L58_009793 [Maublancomyces gigas]|uniref:NACHT domain-containing protein n=1 Tax=Discina gigas TaxID=1032678 RepID=A0ABR3G6K9_9PEZI